MKIEMFKYETDYLKDGEPFQPSAEDKLFWAIYRRPAGVTVEGHRVLVAQKEIVTKKAWTEMWDDLHFRSDVSEVVATL